MKQLGMFSLVIAAILTAFAISNAAAEVCTGEDITFTKVDSADWTLAANQDRITDNVWLTRGNAKGLFNIKVEFEFDKSTNAAPADTEWALGSAANFASLTFDTFRKTFSDAVGINIVGEHAVVHLITDDKFLDIEFRTWTKNDSGGGFSYKRSMCAAGPTPTATPTTSPTATPTTSPTATPTTSPTATPTTSPTATPTTSPTATPTTSPTPGNPVPDVKANGFDTPVIVGATETDRLLVTVSLDDGGSSSDDDWWLYVITPDKTIFWFTATAGWVPSATPIRSWGGVPEDFSDITVLDVTGGLPIGVYEFVFSLDDSKDDGVKEDKFTDSVTVTVGTCP